MNGEQKAHRVEKLPVKVGLIIRHSPLARSAPRTFFHPDAVVVHRQENAESARRPAV